MDLERRILEGSAGGILNHKSEVGSDDEDEGQVTAHDAAHRVAAVEADRTNAQAAVLYDPMLRQPKGFSSGSSKIKRTLADQQWKSYQSQKISDVAGLKALDASRNVSRCSGTSPGDADIATIDHSSTAAAHDGGKRFDHEMDDDDSGDDGDGFMAAYRAKRLAEITKQALGRVSTRVSYGTLRELVEATDLVTDVDAVPAPQLAVVLFHEPYLPACRAVRTALETVAHNHPHACFLSMRSTVASASFDPIALPAIVAYRGGKVIATILRAHEGIAGGSISDGSKMKPAGSQHRAGQPLTLVPRSAAAIAGDANIYIDAADIEWLLKRQCLLE